MNFNTYKEIIDMATAENITISKLTLRETAIDAKMTEEEVYDDMYKKYKIMKAAIERGLENDNPSPTGLSGDMAFKMKKSVDKGNFSGRFFGEIIYSALAVSEVNACMGCVVAAPTAGSCGVIPACLYTLQRQHNFTDEEIVLALVNASAAGLIIAKNASISGAEGGCQAECGSAAAMIASGMVEAFGGTPEQCGDAVAHALKSLMGLICDPVAGLVEEPCIVRNVAAATVAVSSAELALAGIKTIIPVDEVIVSMGVVGKQLPVELRETARGGLATTPTGLDIQKKIFG